MLKGYSLTAFASKADMPLRALCKIVHNSLSSTAPTWRDSSAALVLLSGFYLVLVALASYGFGAYIAARPVDRHLGNHGIPQWDRRIARLGAGDFVDGLDCVGGCSGRSTLANIFTANCSNSDLRWRSRASPSTWSGGVGRQARDGAPSCAITCRRSPPWICSSSRPLASICSMPSSSFD